LPGGEESGRITPDEPYGASPFEDPLEDLYENAPCGYLSLLPDGGIVKVNRTFLEWTGYGRADVVGRRFQDLLTVGGRIYHETHYAPLLRIQRSVRGIALDVVRADGSPLPVLVNSVLKTGAEDRPLGILTTVFDATDRREYERELLRARRREQAARERTERLQRVTAMLAAARTAQDIAETVVAEVCAGVGADHAALALRDPETERIDIAVHVGGDPVARLARQVLADRGRPPDRSDAVFSEAPEQHPHTLPNVDTEGAPGALAAVTLAVAGPAGLGFDGTRELASEERDFMVACARQCAQALERVRLLEETSRAAHQAEFLARTSRALDESRGVVERAERMVALLVPELAEAASVHGADPEPLAQASRDERARDRLGDRRRTVEHPLISGQLRGKLVLAPKHPPPLPRRTMSFVTELADRCALALENARLYEQERDAAQMLQRSLLAEQLPRDRRFLIATRYRPAGERLEVGGDWYDAFMVSQDTIAVVVGDVVGRGLEAATAMGQLRSAVRALASARQGPAHLLESLDRFVEPLARAQMATLVYVEIALDSGLFCFASAGHPPPLLLETQEQPRFLWDAQSPPVGANLTRLPRPEAQLTLRPDARLLLYTDGLVERRREPLDVGLERLAEQFASQRATPLADLVEHLAEGMGAEARSDDDICVLGFTFAGSARASAVAETTA
jgi:serine/threonine-protein kinase RsbW